MVYPLWPGSTGAGGIAVFHAEVISKHAVVFTLVPSAWIGENLVALWRDGRLSNENEPIAQRIEARRHEPAPPEGNRTP